MPKLSAIIVPALAAVLAALSGGGALASLGVQGAVGNVSASDGAALILVGCRAWSLSDSGFNRNQIVDNPTCVDERCLRQWRPAQGTLEPGGFICNGEDTIAYANDQDNQIFYQLVDGELNAGACNHIAYFSAQGLVASNGSVSHPAGDYRQAGCPGTAAVNCFERADSRNARAVPLTNVLFGYGTSNPHEIRSIGGLSPVPTVRVTSPGGGGCPPGETRLTWDNPEIYQPAMKNGVPSPVKGVRLYRNDGGCAACPNGTTGWTPVGDFDRMAGPIGTCAPVVAPGSWFSLSVRLKGPNALLDPSREVETGHSGTEGFVGASSQCVAVDSTATRIATVSARYAGRGRISVRFSSGTEGGLEGYYVTRSRFLAAAFTRVSGLISPAGDGSTYAYTDRPRPSLGTVYYAIEVLAADGTSQSAGPVAAHLPAPAQRKARED